MHVPPPNPASVAFKQKLIDVPLSPAGKVQHCWYPVSVQSLSFVHNRTTLAPVVGQPSLGDVAHAVLAAQAMTVLLLQPASVSVDVVVKQHTGAVVVQFAGDSHVAPFPASVAASPVPPLSPPPLLLPPPPLLLPAPPLLLPAPPLLLPVPPPSGGGDVEVLLLQAARPTERTIDTKQARISMGFSLKLPAYHDSVREPRLLRVEELGAVMVSPSERANS